MMATSDNVVRTYLQLLKTLVQQNKISALAVQKALPSLRLEKEFFSDLIYNGCPLNNAPYLCNLFEKLRKTLSNNAGIPVRNCIIIAYKYQTAMTRYFNEERMARGLNTHDLKTAAELIAALFDWLYIVGQAISGRSDKDKIFSLLCRVLIDLQLTATASTPKRTLSGPSMDNPAEDLNTALFLIHDDQEEELINQDKLITGLELTDHIARLNAATPPPHGFIRQATTQQLIFAQYLEGKQRFGH